jgi:hypothetical protein
MFGLGICVKIIKKYLTTGIEMKQNRAVYILIAVMLLAVLNLSLILIHRGENPGSGTNGVDSQSGASPDSAPKVDGATSATANSAPGEAGNPDAVTSATGSTPGADTADSVTSASPQQPSPSEPATQPDTVTSPTPAPEPSPAPPDTVTGPTPAPQPSPEPAPDTTTGPTPQPGPSPKPAPEPEEVEEREEDETEDNEAGLDRIFLRAEAAIDAAVHEVVSSFSFWV